MDDVPEQMGFEPLTAIETVGVGFTVNTRKSETSGHELFPGC